MISKTVNAHIDDLSPLVLPATEGDTMWRWDFRLYYTGQRWTIPSGCTVMITGMKPDGNVFEYGAVVADNEARVSCTEQMTAAPGAVRCSLRVLDGNEGVLAVKNFILAVTPAPQTGVTPSETVLPIYEEALETLNRSLAGMEVSAETLSPGADATVAVTGGGSTGDPYNIHFGLPRGNVGPAATVTGTTVKYKTTDSGTTPPSTWDNSPTIIKGKWLWTKTTVATNGGNFDVVAVTYLGIDGSGAVDSVQGMTGDVDLDDFIIFRTFQATSFPSDYSMVIKFSIPEGYSYLAFTGLLFSGGALPWVWIGGDATSDNQYNSPYIVVFCGVGGNTAQWSKISSANVFAGFLFRKNNPSS